MRFRVRALGATASVNEIEVDAVDASAARRLIVDRGLSVMSVTPLRASASRARFPLMLFNQELVALLKAGIPLAEALAALAEKEARPAVHAVVAALGEGLREGRSLSTALEAQPLFEDKTWQLSPEAWPLSPAQLAELEAGEVFTADEVRATLAAREG